MKLNKLDNTERIVLVASIFLAALVFASSAYLHFNPPVQVLEVKVFDVYESNGKTFILTYGEGKIKLNGIYDIEVGATYRITYQSRQRYVANIVIDIEKIS